MEKTNSLQDTLREVIGETMTPQSSTSQETNDSNVAASDETTSGETSEKEYVAGVDISDIPEQDRPRFKEKFLQKVKSVEKGAQDKFQEIAKYKKEKDSILASGVTEDEAIDVLNKYVESKRTQTNTTSKQETLRTLDKMIKDSPYEQQESLKNLRQIVKEEAGTDKMEAALAKIEQLERAVGYFNQDFSDKRASQVNSQLNELSKEFGKDFIEKHREKVVSESLKYPKADPEQILNAISDPRELRKAILSNSKPTVKAVTQEKLNAITSSGSGVSGAKEAISTKLPWKNFLAEVTRR